MITAENLGAFVKKYDASFRDVGRVFLSHVDRALTREAVLVDVGCGRTSYGADIYRKAGKRIGLDVDAYAKENPLMDEVLIMNDETFPLPDACADVVTAQWVVEHVKHPEIFLAETRRILRPGGAFVFMTTNYRCPLIWASSFFPTRLKAVLRSRLMGYAPDETFKTAYAMNTPAKLRQLAEKHGFAVAELERVESHGYMRFSVVALWLYIQWTKALRMCTHEREMHLVGVFKKTR